MNLRECRFLLDANVPPALREFLSGERLDFIRVIDRLAADASDNEILQLSVSENLVVVTQDVDFGTLAFRDQLPFYGVVFLRPGHIKGEETAQTFRTLIEQNLSFREPFIVVATNQGGEITIRVRQPSA